MNFQKFTRIVEDNPQSVILLEYILPYAGHRKKNMEAGSQCISLRDVQEMEEQAVSSSLLSSPVNRIRSKEIHPVLLL
jgi:hypothetical protein